MKSLSRANFYLFLIFILFSCYYEDIPRCDGSLIVEVSATTNLTSCAANDGTIIVEAARGISPYQYSLNGGAQQSSSTFSGLSAGEYQVKVFDAMGCEAEVTNIEIVVPDSDLDLTATPTADSDCSSNNGSINLTATGGSGGYTYSLNSGSFGTNSNFTSLAPATYSVTVKDSEGCQKTVSANVVQGNTGTSWSSQVKDILALRCVACHPGSGGTSDDWGNYTSVFSKRSNIRARVSGGTMPPAGQTQLTATQKALIVCWIDDGAPNN